MIVHKDALFEAGQGPHQRRHRDVPGGATERGRKGM